MSTQVGKLIARIAENLPDKTSEEMQWLIQHPVQLGHFLKGLKHDLPFFLSGQEVFKDMQLIRLHETWNFMILTSRLYPELGIAVSALSGACGNSGWGLVFRDDFGHEELFMPPCGCCGWYTSLSGKPRRDSEGDCRDLILKTCRAHRITTLILTMWFSTFKFEEEGTLMLVDLRRREEMKLIDKQRFVDAFGKLMKISGPLTPANTPVSLEEYFARL